MTFQGKISLEELTFGQFKGGLVEGANVRTPCGLRRIELVRPGDLIVTRNNGLQAVRMVWKRTVTQDAMQLNGALAPIRLKPRAIGPMMPQRDLLVAQDHRLLIPGFRLAGVPDNECILTEAREIAGTSDAVYVDFSLDSVTYYQLVFDCHQVLAANSLPVESFLPDAKAIEALGGDMRDALEQRYPQLRKEPGAYPPAEFQIASDVEFLPDFA
ncbi:Hint domain-containing protein [Arenibacterium sp. CAU 1754]